ncbi:exopolysaccharide transport family protein [Xanthobacter sp. TB0136]|uniref:exopolysaccharide transport family protein n=1 Tax=Xanthobacter sp. TB0136 TaxID=3459177 RepID=UPI004039DCE9
MSATGTPATEATPSFTLRDFLIFAFYHIRIVVIAAMLPILVGIIASLIVKTEYTASSKLLVIVSREVSNEQGVTDSGPSVLTIEGLKQVESEVQMLESAEVVRSTIEQVGMDKLFPSGPLTWLSNTFSSHHDIMDKAIDRFRRNLHAGVMADSNVLEVSYTNPSREIAVETTNALVQNYLAMRRKIFENPTSQILNVEVERFQADLKQVDADIEALKNRVGVIDFQNDAILASNQLDSILQRTRQVEEREAALNAQLAEAEKQLAAMPRSVFDFSQKSDSSNVDDADNLLAKLLVERDRLVAQYAPSSVLIQQHDKKIATVRSMIKNRGATPYYTDRASRNPAIDYTENLVLNLRVERDSILNQKKELAAQSVAATERLDILRKAETRLIELQRARETLSEGYREYLRRAVAAKLEEAASRTRESNVRLIQPAGSDVSKRSLALPLLVGGLFGGLLFGGAAGTIASVLRSIFIVPREAERLLDLPDIVTLDAGAESATGPKVEHAISSCATMLLDTRVDDRPLRVVHFLASEKDDTLAWFVHRLAEELAIQRKMRTLVVDLCSPSPYPINTGNVQVKGGLAITPTPVEMLWSAADVERSPLLSVRLPVAEGAEMLSVLKAEFDFIIICSVMQGSSLINRRLSQLSDGTVISVHAEKTRKMAAVNMRDTVEESGGALLGLSFFGRQYYLPQWLYKYT